MSFPKQNLIPEVITILEFWKLTLTLTQLQTLIKTPNCILQTSAALSMWSSIIVWPSGRISIHLFFPFSQCDPKTSLPGFTESYIVLHCIYQLHAVLWTDSSHLDIAVIVASVTAVAWVHQNSVETVHYRVAWALRHVGSDIQEFWVGHILKTSSRIIWSLKK